MSEWLSNLRTGVLRRVQLPTVRLPRARTVPSLLKIGQTTAIAFALFLAIAPVGMELVILNVPEPIFQRFINSSFYTNHGSHLNESTSSLIWGLINAAQSIGALLGTLIAVPMGERLGRKNGLLVINNVVLIVGCGVMGLAYPFDSFELIFIGRLLAGISTGLVCVLLPMFLLETVPAETRGAFGCSIHVFICVGSAIGGVLSLEFILGGETTWPYLLASPAVIGFVLIGLSFIFPETPQFLLKHGEGRMVPASILFYYGPRVNMIRKLEEIEREMDEAPSQLDPVEVMSDRVMRRGVLIGIVANVAQIFSGSMATISYSSTMFGNVGLPPYIIPYLPALGAMGSGFLTLPGVYLVEKSGRRQLLLWMLFLGLIGDIGMFFFSVLIDFQPSTESWANLIFSFFFVLWGASYNLGPGPIAYFIAGELVAPEASGVSLGIGVATNWLSSTATNFLYFPLQHAVGGFAYLLFVIPSAICLPILYYTLPETRVAPKIRRPSWGDSTSPKVRRPSYNDPGTGSVSGRNRIASKSLDGHGYTNYGSIIANGDIELST